MTLENIKSFFYIIFSFDERYPLLFTQFYFWAFFAIVFAIFSLVHSRRLLRNAFLFFASLFFYYKTSGLFVLILILSTLYGFYIGKRIGKLEKKRPRKTYLVIGVVVNLLVLCYFKYAYFFTDVYNNLFHTDYEVINYLAKWANDWGNSTRFDASKILLPVGISFYTFQNISYLVDVYRKRVEPVSNILDFGFYTAFFPQLVAGPIIRANQFIPQLYKKFSLSRKQFGIAVFWILNGLLKKLILSDYLAVNFVDRVIDNPILFTGFENLMAIFVYSLQVYADFSGYTDIAIGVAMLMGFYLPINFNSPYKATNCGDFWRRWHISLSTWLKDYLYIPLGGSRKGKFRTHINLMTTMLLGGLWHGASWNFMIWGGLNGCGIIIFKIWRNMKKYARTILTFTLFAGFSTFNILFPHPALMIGTVWTGVIFFGTFIDQIYSLIIKNKPVKWLNRAWSILLTFVFITFTRLFFRSGSNLDPAEANRMAWETAQNMVMRIGGKWQLDLIPQILYEYRFVFILFLVGMIIHWLPTRWKRWYRLNFAMLPIWLIAAISIAVIFLSYQFVTADLQPFIYFQF
ncbi:MBOAT family protein [Bacteroidales bacterium OttesenSCG-928-B11]|nr:MBOAT family protein [Bacteroidales bacterium OttesenSCG-928-C03]MDL2312737.1 MBOAT family protein [Bacteroidales bacterium OttesenSCG-928-B11]